MRLGRLQVALVARAGRSARRLVMPTGWRERQALERLEARGLATWAWGLPDVWRVPCCSICRRLLNVPSDPDSIDCGGDCWGCMRAIEAELCDG